jgi:hypothetical protein
MWGFGVKVESTIIFSIKISGNVFLCNCFSLHSRALENKCTKIIVKLGTCVDRSLLLGSLPCLWSNSVLVPVLCGLGF